MERTPSGPTLSMASAIMMPMVSSFPAEIVATAAEIEKHSKQIHYKRRTFIRPIIQRLEIISR